MPKPPMPIRCLVAQKPLKVTRLARANLKAVERILGVSYPTVRWRFDNLLRVLGYKAALSGGVGIARRAACAARVR